MCFPFQYFIIPSAWSVLTISYELMANSWLMSGIQNFKIALTDSLRIDIFFFFYVLSFIYLFCFSPLPPKHHRRIRYRTRRSVSAECTNASFFFSLYNIPHKHAIHAELFYHLWTHVVSVSFYGRFQSPSQRCSLGTQKKNPSSRPTAGFESHIITRKTIFRCRLGRFNGNHSVVTRVRDWCVMTTASEETSSIFFTIPLC